MRIFAPFGARVRGFKVIDLAAIAVLTVLVLVVYLAKAGAGGTRADIDQVQQQIVDEQTQIRLLRAEVAAEEQPARLANLSAQLLHLQPIAPAHEIQSESLPDVAHAPPPKPDPATLAAPQVAINETAASPAPPQAPAAPAQAAR